MKRLWRLLTRDWLTPSTDRRPVCLLLMFPLMMAGSVGGSLALMADGWVRLVAVMTATILGAWVVILSEFPDREDEDGDG